MSCAALRELLQGSQQLHKLVLPLQLELASVLEGRPCSVDVDEEQEKQVVLLLAQA